MTEQQRKTSKRRAFHLEVVDTQSFILKCLNLCIKFRIGERSTEFSALRAIESATGNGNSSHHIIGSNLFQQLLIIIYAVWISYLVYPLHLALEFSLCLEVTDLIAAGIEIDESVETDTLL